MEPYIINVENTLNDDESQKIKAWEQAWKQVNERGINIKYTNQTIRFTIECTADEIDSKKNAFTVLYYFFNSIKGIMIQARIELIISISAGLAQDPQWIKNEIIKQYNKTIKKYPDYKNLKLTLTVLPEISKICVINNMIGWMNAFGLINISYSLADNSRLEIKLVKSIEFEIEKISDTDLCDLKYYFPIRDYIIKQNVQTSICIKIKEIVSEEDKGRLEALLNSIQIKPQEFDVKYKEKRKGNDATDKPVAFSKSNSLGDILPLLILKSDKEEYGKELDSVIKIYREYVFNIENYSGISIEPMYDKEKLKKELCCELYGIETAQDSKPLIHFSEEDKLSVLILFFLLREYVESKSIFQCIEDKKEKEDKKREKKKKDEYHWELNKNLLNKTIMDSKSYGEGLWQLIENAFLHSQGKVAFFGIRFHKANTDISMGEIAKNAKTREMLWRKYAHEKETDNIFNKPDKDGKKLYSDFLEFFVLDDAVGEDGEGHGIIEAIKKDQGALKEDVVIDSIKKIFNLEEKDYKDEIGNKNITGKEEFYIKHYGMRWLKHHVERLNGKILLYSPPPKSDTETIGEYYYNNGKKEVPEGINPNDIFFTSYSILLPISYNTEEEQSDAVTVKKPDKTNPYFTSDVENFNKMVYKAIEMEFPHSDNKEESIENLFDIIIKEINSGSEPYYLKLPDNITPQDIEILAKCLFLLVYKKRNDTIQLRILIDFDVHNELINEFVRIYSVFYLKQNQNTYMKNVQIAICSKPDENSKADINFIIAGENIESALLTANNFVYYNADSALEYVPLLRYLVRYNKDETSDTDSAQGKSGNEPESGIEPVSLFPFELLPVDKNKGCFFLNNMQTALNTCIWINRLGCKIPDVRVRLGSKIIIDNFYEAELLFHNFGNIKRFAYMIAADIVKNKDDFWVETASTDGQHDKSSNSTSPVTLNFIIGYENYSAVLVQEVAAILSEIELNGSKREFLWAIDSRSVGTYPVMDLANTISRELKEEIKNQGIDKINLITIVPVGSTMSTVYKVHNSFKRGIYKEIERGSCKSVKYNYRNYSIVAVGKFFKPQETNDENEIYLRYFTDQPHKSYPWNSIVLKDETNTTETNESKVYYCLTADAKWYEPKPEPDKIFITKPLIHVDQTSTMLNASFRVKLPDEILKYYRRSNESDWKGGKIEALKPNGNEIDLKPYFYYGHICQNENHYQFYFDFEKITNEFITDIKKWLKSLDTKSQCFIEPDAYNVVISALSRTNALFLECVIDTLFGTNLHLLHIDINNIEKEDVRVRFSYISKELKRIQMSYAKVNFYYIDDSIYTGKSIERAEKFIRMLCHQTGVTLENVLSESGNYIFNKVILLINRSSYETAHQWVANPVKDWVAYIDIAVPPYNMHANICPGCLVKDRYELLYKRSVTNDMSEYFQKKNNKHSVRTLEKYKQWIENEINEGHYSNWLKIYCESNNQDISKLDTNQKKDRLYLLIYNDWYLRLKTMNEAYLELVYMQDLLITPDAPTGVENNGTPTDYVKIYMEAILKLLSKSFESDSKYDQVMMFISYIKVISREYLAKIYYIREAIYKILHCVLIILIEKKVSDDSGEKYSIEQFEDKLKKELYEFDSKNDGTVLKYYKIIINGIRNIREPEISGELQLRIFKIVTHRLALLHSDYMIKPDNVRKVIDAYCAMMKDESDDDSNKNRKYNEVLNDFLASVKMATMSEDNNAMCYSLYDLYNKLK